MLNDNLPIALYQQLVREFTAKIRNNAWPVGCMLPGEMQLCREYNVSRSTVRQAMDVLVRNGLVTRKQGRGTFVAMPKLEQNLVKFYSFSEEIKRMGYTPSSSIVSFRKLPADANMAARLSIDPNSEIFSLRRLRLADGKPFALETSYIPAALYPFMTEEMIREKGLYQTMRQNSSFQPDTAVETFQAILISKADAKLFERRPPGPGPECEPRYIVRRCHCGDMRKHRAGGPVSVYRGPPLLIRAGYCIQYTYRCGKLPKALPQRFFHPPIKLAFTSPTLLPPYSRHPMAVFAQTQLCQCISGSGLCGNAQRGGPMGSR